MVARVRSVKPIHESGVTPTVGCSCRSLLSRAWLEPVARHAGEAQAALAAEPDDARAGSQASSSESPRLCYDRERL